MITALATRRDAQANHFRREGRDHNDGLRVLEPQRIALARWLGHVAEGLPLPSDLNRDE